MSQKQAVQEKPAFDVVGQIMAYENDEMSEEQVIAFFQQLIDIGVVWQLQGHYGRTAKALIENGNCHAASNDVG